MLACYFPNRMRCCETIFKRNDVALKFRVDTQTELEEKQNKLSQLSEGQVGLQDRVARTSVLSPVKGTIKTIKVNTVGGVVQPGMDLVEVVPMEDNLLIEARVLPKDMRVPATRIGGNC